MREKLEKRVSEREFGKESERERNCEAVGEDVFIH